jgi:hypothetical protein
LASRAVRGEPVFPYLSALRAAESIGKIPESLILAGDTGLEPMTSGSGDNDVLFILIYLSFYLLTNY